MNTTFQDNSLASPLDSPIPSWFGTTVDNVVAPLRSDLQEMRGSVQDLRLLVNEMKVDLKRVGLVSFSFENTRLSYCTVCGWIEPFFKKPPLPPLHSLQDVDDALTGPQVLQYFTGYGVVPTTNSNRNCQLLKRAIADRVM